MIKYIVAIFIIFLFYFFLTFFKLSILERYIFYTTRATELGNKVVVRVTAVALLFY